MKRLLLPFLLCIVSICNGQTSEQTINDFIDAWHRAAATADAEVFFGSMSEDGIYIGTDKSERWLRDELREWSKKFFERDKAWDFKPIERAVYFDDKENTAWFNETLDTWMGVCRGSGTLTKDKKEGWKLRHYHLSVTVDNELINGFLSLINSEPNPAEDEKAIKELIDGMFKGMKAGEGSQVSKVFAENARLITTGIKEGEPKNRQEEISNFTEAVNNKADDQVWDERILGYDIKIDQTMATVWTPYHFYLNGELLHCGVNTFHLIKTLNGWKITQLMDTRRKEGCDIGKK